MILFIKGTPAEIDEFLYGDCEEINRIAEEDNPNIPIGDDEEDEIPPCTPEDEARINVTNSILDYLKGAKVIIASETGKSATAPDTAEVLEKALDNLIRALK